MKCEYYNERNEGGCSDTINHYLYLSAGISYVYSMCDDCYKNTTTNDFRQKCTLITTEEFVVHKVMKS